ncbi:recombination regulator RecX [Streptomyces cavernae]|uniref:recombination regulator RecX n=1 Tax=Streptomyces cavernae TaxID=2259034 RepID=UPI000FEBEB75|nr:recombination regulator RecX [Streptomyces cavernae]
MPDSKAWRTDWAEYAHPVAPQRPGRGSGGSAGQGAGPHDRKRGNGGDGAHGGGDSYADRAYANDGAAHVDDGAYADGAANVDDGAYGGDPDGQGPPDGSGPPGGGLERGGRRHDDASRDDGHGDGRNRATGRRGSGGPRGRRRAGGFGEASRRPQDGGSPPSSRAEEGEPHPGDPAERARAICLRLLTGTPRTRKQLADALRKRDIPEDVAEEVLSRFEEVGLIDDGAFADAWVESRHHGRGLARRALARELRTRGVDSSLIDEAVGQLDSEQEETTARELVERKLRSTRGLDRDKRLRRLAGMLARKGYPEGMALRVVRQALEEAGEDTDGLEDDQY